MSRFADPTRTEVVDLGPCQCPGSPHERDEAVVRYQLGGSAWARLGSAELQRRAGDPLAVWRQTVLETVVSWNLQLTTPDGEVVAAPVAAAVVKELDADTLEAISDAVETLLADKGNLPKPSGAPSPASSRESASPAQMPAQTPGT